MYKIVKHSDRAPKIYDAETHRIRCNFCDNYLQLEKGEYESRRGPYVCPECEERLTTRYEYTWKNFENLSRSDYGKKLLDWLWSFHDIVDENFIYEMNQELSSPCPICGKLHTPRDWAERKYHICKDCFVDLPGYKEGKINSVRSCETHGFYISHNPNGKIGVCPTCSEKAREKICQRCGKKYRDTNEISKVNRGDSKLCPDCYNDVCTPGRMIPRYCNSCGSWKAVSHNFDNCPDCGKGLNRYKITCASCKKEVCVDNAAKTLCHDCEIEAGKSDSVKEFERMKIHPMVKIIKNKVLLPLYSVEDKNQRYNIAKMCENCGRPYWAHSNDSRFCGSCRNIVTCDVCGYEFATNPVNPHTTCSHSCARKRDLTALWKEKGICNAPGSKKIDFDKTNDKLSGIIYHNKRIEITDDNCYEFRKSGVWYRESVDGKILQVSQTVNIYNEYVKLKSTVDSVLSGKTVTGSYSRMKDDGIDLEKTRCFVLEFEDDIQRRFNIEAKFAVDNKVEYWRSAPGYQTTLVNNVDV